MFVALLANTTLVPSPEMAGEAPPWSAVDSSLRTLAMIVVPAVRSRTYTFSSPATPPASSAALLKAT